MFSKQDVGRWLPLMVVLAATYLIGAYSLLYRPMFGDVGAVSKSPALFVLSLQAFLLLLASAVVLYNTWLQGNRKNEAHVFWAVGFALFSALFMGLMLDAMGIRLADMHIPSVFFMWRQLMIISLALLYYGISKVVFKKNILSKLPTALIVIAGYAIFVYGLLLGPKDIEWTMYGFLTLVFVPVSLLISYLFYIYWRETRMKSPGYLSLGFMGVAITYMAWAPWHTTKFYFVWFGLFVLSLVPLLVGIVMIRERTVEPIIKKPSKR